MASRYTRVEIALALLQVPLMLHLDGNNQNYISFSAVDMQEGTFGDIEAQPHPPNSLRAVVQHPLEFIGLADDEDLIVWVGQDDQSEEAEPSWGHHDCCKKGFHGQIHFSLDWVLPIND